MLKRLLFAPVLITLAASADAQVCLVSKGHARGVVVTADAPSKTATYAAEELVRHVRLATGVELRVVKESQRLPPMYTRVFVGETEAAATNGIDPIRLEREAYVLRSVGDDLLIVGREDDSDPLLRHNSNVGTLWGVYDFLENVLDVRWLWPGRLGTHVPKTKTIQLASIDRTASPALRFRELAWSRTRQIIDGRAKLDPRDARLGFSHDVLQDYGEALRVFLRRHRMGGMDAKPPTGHRFHSSMKTSSRRPPRASSWGPISTRSSCRGRIPTCAGSPCPTKPCSRSSSSGWDGKGRASEWVTGPIIFTTDT